MTELNKWVLIEAGHDEDEYDIDVNILAVFDNEEDAKEKLKAIADDHDGCDISWNNEDTKVTITSGYDCDGWCKVYEIKKI